MGSVFEAYGTGLTMYRNFLVRSFLSLANRCADFSSSKTLTAPNDKSCPSLFVRKRSTTYFERDGHLDGAHSLISLPSTTLLFFRPTARLSDLVVLVGFDEGLELSEVPVWVSMVELLPFADRVALFHFNSSRNLSSTYRSFW